MFTFRTILLFAIPFVIVVLILVIPKIWTKAPSTWKSYLTGQGIFLFIFLAIGWAAAWSSSYYGPRKGQISTGGQLIEHRKLNPSDQIQNLGEINLANYSHVTVLTRTTAPENSSAIVTIYEYRDRPTEAATSRIESVSAWSRWDQQDPRGSIRIMVEPPAKADQALATEVDVLIYLATK